MSKYTKVLSYDWAFSHAKIDTSWFLCKKLEIFNRKLMWKIKQKLINFCTNLRYWRKLSIWYFICRNLINSSEMAFIYIISTNLVDIDFNCELKLFFLALNLLTYIYIKITLSVIKIDCGTNFLKRAVLQSISCFMEKEYLNNS